MPKIKVLKGFKHTNDGHTIVHYDAGLEVEVSQACLESCMEMGACELIDAKEVQKPNEDERVKLYDECIALGLKPNKNTGIVKLEGYIKAELERVIAEELALLLTSSEQPKTFLLKNQTIVTISEVVRDAIIVSGLSDTGWSDLVSSDLAKSEALIQAEVDKLDLQERETE